MKKPPVIIETSVGKFLVRDLNPPLPLRSSPRKKKIKIKKQIKRLEKTQIPMKRPKKQIQKPVEEEKEEEEQQLLEEDFEEKELNDDEEQSSFLFVISSEDEDGKSAQIIEKESTDIDGRYSLCFSSITRRRALIFSPPSSRMTLLGLFSVEQLSGPAASLHGFTLRSSTRYPVFNLSSQSLMSIETGSAIHSKESYEDEQLVTLFSRYNIDLTYPNICFELIQKLANNHRNLSIFLIEHLETAWTESMREYTNSGLFNEWLYNTNGEDHRHGGGFKQLWPNLGAFKECKHHTVRYSIETRTITDEILSHLRSPNQHQPLTVFVCGAKDSGKSTYLRYLINRCLSLIHPLRIAFLDSDIGQSEFTPSGCISFIDKCTLPLFGPSSSHLIKPIKSFYFGNIQVENDLISTFLNYVKICLTKIKEQQFDLILVNTMGWGADSGLIVMKELIDLIQPNFIVQLRALNASFRNTMPDINHEWSRSTPNSIVYRQENNIPLDYFYNDYDYRLLLTPIRHHQHHRGKSSSTRQACLWSYFAQLETKQESPIARPLKPLIDYTNETQILQFERLGIGLLHRQVEARHLLQVLNGSIVALCRVKPDMLYHPSSAFPALIDERASIECLGFGFIRSIDMVRRQIHVLIPDRNLSKIMINAVIKGHDDCPDEFYYMAIDRWRGHMPPYVTGVFNNV